MRKRVFFSSHEFSIKAIRENFSKTRPCLIELHTLKPAIFTRPYKRNEFAKSLETRDMFEYSTNAPNEITLNPSTSAERVHLAENVTKIRTSCEITAEMIEFRQRQTAGANTANLRGRSCEFGFCLQC